MFKHSTNKVSNDHVNQIVKSILNKRQKNVLEQQQTFIRRNTDENNKRNNYLVDKFTMKKSKSSTKENQTIPTTKLISPKKKTTIEIFDDDDDDNDFISSKKRPKLTEPTKKSVSRKSPIDPVQECLESIISQIENNDATCPICYKILSNSMTIDQRQEHVNRCLEQSQFNNIETKQQKTLLSYSKFSSTSSTRKPSTTSNFKCQICGMSFSVKRTYLTHLKKCSNENSVQLKHVVNFAAKMSEVNETKTVTSNNKKKPENHIKNRVIKMEIPMNEDDEQQQLAIALSASIKTATEPPNAFDILQAAATKKTKTIDLLATPLWNISTEDRLKLSSTRLTNLCERVIITSPSTDTYKFPSSSLLLFSQTNFGPVNWWNITATDPQDEEIPMSQLARILDDNDEDHDNAGGPVI